MPALLRVFLDANILFSASWKEGHRFLQFWTTRNIVPMISAYVADETRRNCIGPGHASRLARLLEQSHQVSDIPGAFLPRGIVLPAKDAPVLVAAIHAGADFLITGDRHHFRKWMNMPIQTHLGTIVIQEPAQFLDEHLDPL